jgi:hypothetical protein
VGYVERFEHAFLARREDRPPSRSLTFTDAGLVLGAGTFVAPMRRGGGGAATLDLSGEDRILALLAAAFSGPVNRAVLGKLRRASELWAQGEKCLAQIHLEHLRLPRLESEEQAFRLFLADYLIASGYSPRDLCGVLGFDLPEGLKKYNPDEPRDDHGRWTTGGASGGSTEDAPARGGSSRSHAEAPSSAAASGMEAAAGVAAEGTVLGPLSAEALAGLASIAAGIAGAAAAFGLVFIPSPNAGVTSQGAVPGEPGLDYSLDHDEGSLRITRTGPAGDEVLAAAHLGQDGVYRDENGVPVARAVGGSVIIDPDAARAATAAQDAQDDEDADQMAGAMAEPDAKTEEPKLCPEPVLDTPHGASDRARAYEELIHNLVNPENPLPQGFGVSLLNPISGNIVFFDDCIQTSGIMVDAKGPGYADLLSQEFQQREDVGASVKLLEQATRQTEAAGARPIIWFFAEESAADYVRKLFERDVRLNQIEVVFYPPMGGN